MHNIFTKIPYNQDMKELSKKILIVDDEPQILRVLEAYLDKEGYRVVTAKDGSQALSIFDLEKPDFVILDLNLPSMDGLDVCREIRRDSNVPILMLTARVEEIDKLVGLEIGADDYVVKPFSPREVVARVRTILKRVRPEDQSDEIIRRGRLTINQAQHTVILDDRAIELTPTEFQILVTLASTPKRVFSRLQLMEQSQGSAYEGYERTIDAHVKNLRNKLEPDPRNPIFIHTVFGLGYKFETGDNEE